MNWVKTPIMTILLVLLIGSTNDAFAASPEAVSFVLNDVDRSKPAYSNGDTFTITFDIDTDRGGFPLNTAVGQVNVTELFDMTHSLGTTYDGQWTSDKVFVITVTDITGNGIIFGTTSADPSNIEITDAANPLDVWFEPSSTLQLQTTGNGGECDSTCSVPTLGMDKTGTRIVENGFSYNGNPVNVESFFTPYPLIKTETGKNNIARLKIYDALGPENIQHVELAFGLKKGNTINERTASIFWDRYHDGTETVNVYSPTNAIDNVRVHSQKDYCSSDKETACLLLSIQHRFRTPLDFDIVGTNVWNKQRSSWQNYFNHGVDVYGKSMNPSPTHYGISNGKLIQLTETENAVAYDKEGNKWIFDTVWQKLESSMGKIDDGVTSHWFDRNNARFDTYKMGQELLAQQTFNEITGGDVQNHDLEEPKTFYPEFVKRSENPELQKRILEEKQEAEELFKILFNIKSKY